MWAKRGNMKPQDDLYDARFCSLCQPKTTSAAKRSLCLGMALALTIGAVQLSAQDQPWPPDDDNGSNNGQPVPIPQYTPNQQYGSSQPQYPQDYPQQQQAYGNAPYQEQGYGPTQQPLSPNDLTQLVAPIALYPDALVAQILTAATYPAQVSAADRWRRSMGNAPADQIAAGADAQAAWDPSVKALTAFTQVLDTLAGNLQWTTSLGNAYYNQPQDVLQTIQVMRQRAQEAGNLQNTPQQQIANNGGYIDIAPANPQVVYVPTYNPWAVYGAPISPYPGFCYFGGLGSFFGASPVQFGLSFAIGAFMHATWGFFGWGLDWRGHSAMFNHNDYWTRSNSVRDWGFPRGGPRAYPGNPQWIHGGDRYGSSRNGGLQPRLVAAQQRLHSRSRPARRALRSARSALGRCPHAGRLQSRLRNILAPHGPYAAGVQPAGAVSAFRLWLQFLRPGAQQLHQSARHVYQPIAALPRPAERVQRAQLQWIWRHSVVGLAAALQQLRRLSPEDIQLQRRRPLRVGRLQRRRWSLLWWQQPLVRRGPLIRWGRSLKRWSFRRWPSSLRPDPHRVSVSASVALLICAVRSSLSQLNGLPSIARITVLNSTIEKTCR